MSVEIVFETHSTSIDNERWVATGWLQGQLSETGKQQAKLEEVVGPFDWQPGWEYVAQR